MTTPASRAQRPRLALQPLLVKLYKLAGIAALALILVGIVAYVVVNIFYFFNTSWVRPVILSPRHPQVAAATTELTTAEARLATLEVERARVAAELNRTARVIASARQFVTDHRAAIESAGHTAAAASARRELDRALLDEQSATDDRVAAELAATTLDREIANAKALVARLSTSYYLRARSEQVVVGFVPYENLAEAKPGTPLYRCTWGLVRCRAVGKVVAVLDGEVTEHHPHNGATKRGVMLELRLTDASAGQDDVLFAGGKPFWLF
ncbi:MAG: hypothetical protein KBG48_14415 [Kofleriaceae bacterium]|jgi:hypothetical protein|nr:hypothetical protein [Kofleriaceae bacterium]MBP9168586.1 hypothetical protein [Kofleriaceae bacterium]MBP9857540.1 hypothetical protein [Kofleriaceae bacterium]